MRENYFADRSVLTEDDLAQPSIIECELLQNFIVRWRELTFGVHTTPADQMYRMFNEIKELKDLIQSKSELTWPEFKDINKQVKKELADILIVMFCVAASMNFDLIDAVKDKMKINLTREWEVTGPGVARHTKKSPYELEDQEKE